MAAISSSLLYLNTHRSPPFSRQFQSNAQTKPISVRVSIVKAQAPSRKEDIVIVGAGIAGLSTALALHRLGVGSMVLEQADSLRTGGTSLTLFKNGWRVLDTLGVGNDLRRQFLEIQGYIHVHFPVQFHSSMGQ